MKRRISNDLRLYVSYVRVAEAHLALAEEISSKNRKYYDLIKDKMQKWVYNILNIFEKGMAEKGKYHYADIVGVLRKRIEDRFRGIDNLNLEEALE